ncbi:MAG TPA: VOC family protein [Ktedonobacteraceae bacterium]|nr:VOC family protein [Ktedonobacteraceae bacterium]
MSSEQAISFKGIHHIALATAHLEDTIHFYRDVLGMQVSEIYPSREGRGRHCLVLLKPDDNDIWGFHFFERSLSGERSSDQAGENSGEALLHIALRLQDEAAAHMLKERLHKARGAITDIPELGSFLFADNNNIFLEATWPRASAGA